MSELVIEGRILRWGNSYGVRIRKGDLEASGVSPGEEVTVRIEPDPTGVDLSELPTFRSGDARTSQAHDAVLGGHRSAEHLRPDADAEDDRDGPEEGETRAEDVEGPG